MFRDNFWYFHRTCVCTVIITPPRRPSFLSLSQLPVRSAIRHYRKNVFNLVSKKYKSLGTNSGLSSGDTDVAPSCFGSADLSVCVPYGADRHVSSPLPIMGRSKPSRPQSPNLALSDLFLFTISQWTENDVFLPRDDEKANEREWKRWPNRGIT